MKGHLWWLIAHDPLIILKGIVACVICSAFALIYMSIFGDDAELAPALSILLLFGSIFASNSIVNKLFKGRKK